MAVESHSAQFNPHQIEHGSVAWYRLPTKEIENNVIINLTGGSLNK